MTAHYRPRTIDERFFGHTTIVNVPVSLPQENLPEAFTAPVDTTPGAPDLTQSPNKAPSALSKQVFPSPSNWEKAGKFLKKNWIWVVVVAGGAVAVGVVIHRNRQKKKKKDPEFEAPTNQPQQVYFDKEPQQTYPNEQFQEIYPNSQSPLIS